MTKAVSLNSERPWNLIRQYPAYEAAPLVEASLPNGTSLLIKDETNRFNLGAFKALGGIYAVMAFLLDQWEKEHGSVLEASQLFEEPAGQWCSQFTFVCASAGNHGIAVAKGSQMLNARCRVFLSETVPESFAQKLRGLDAEVLRSGSTYEESMAAAQEDCESLEHKEAGKFLLADSSWPGYTVMPTLVMEGYTVLSEEMRQQFLNSGDWPSHVFLQAGVGGLAAGIAYHIRETWSVQPTITIVEPDAAPCLFESQRLGKLTTVAGPVSSMGRLDCKEPSMIAFSILQECADNFVCISDEDAANAVNVLASMGIATTASGAAGAAAFFNGEKLGLEIPEDGRCLVIATEGCV